MNFAFNNTYKKYLCPYNPKTEPGMFFLGNMASGSAAGATSLIFVYPFDLAHTRLAVDASWCDGVREFSGLVDCLQKIMKSDGFIGLYRGFGISVVGIIVYRASYFGMFDTGKIMLFQDIKKANFFAIWMFAQVVTISAVIVSNPLVTIRRRLMMQSGWSTVLYNNTFHCIQTIYKTEGAGAFFNGLLSNVIRSIGGALVLVFYHKIQAYLLWKDQIGRLEDLTIYFYPLFVNFTFNK